MHDNEIDNLCENIRQRKRFNTVRKNLPDEVTDKRYGRREHQEDDRLIRYIILLDKAVDHCDEAYDDEESDYHICQSVGKAISLDKLSHSLVDLEAYALIEIRRIAYGKNE